MSIKQLADGLHVISGLVHVYVIEGPDGLVVLDSGFPGSLRKIERELGVIGRSSKDVRHILLSHAHPDHIGGAAALKRETGAKVWAHPVDAPIMEAGRGFRPVYATPGLPNKIITKLLLGRIKSVDPVKVDGYLNDGDHLPFLPDAQVIHSPGHAAGQVAILWQRHGGVLFTADTCVNFGGLKLPPACEDLALARESLARLAKRRFEMVCVMHGKPVLAGGDALMRNAKF